MQAAERFAAVGSNAQVARELRVGLRQVEKWRKAWREGGTAALRSSGPHCRARLDAELGRGPVAHGWSGGQGWTLARVAALIHRLFKVGYTEPGVSLLLRRNGWSCQVAGRRAIERDEQAVEVWKQEVWPQVEPLRRTWVPGSVSLMRPVKDSGRPRVILGAGADTGRR